MKVPFRKLHFHLKAEAEVENKHIVSGFRFIHSTVSWIYLISLYTCAERKNTNSLRFTNKTNETCWLYCGVESFYGSTEGFIPPAYVALHSSSISYVHRQWWRGLEGLEGVGALARLWVRCLMDGHSSAFLPLCTPNPSLSSPRWWTSSLLWRADKRRPLSSHSALWTLTKRNPLLPVSSSWLCNAVIGGSLPMLSVRSTLESPPRYCHGRIHRILARQWTRFIFISILRPMPLSTDLKSVTDGVKRQTSRSAASRIIL